MKSNPTHHTPNKANFIRSAAFLLIAVIMAGALASCASFKLMMVRYSPDSAFVATAVKAELVKTGFFTTKYAYTSPGLTAVNYKIKHGWAGGTGESSISAGNISVGRTNVDKKFRVIDQATNAETAYIAHLDKSSAKLGGLGMEWARHERYEIFRGGSKVGQADRKNEEPMKIGCDGANWVVRSDGEYENVTAWEFFRDDKLEAILQLTKDGFFTDVYTIYADPSHKDLLPSYSQFLMMLVESVELNRKLDADVKSQSSSSNVKIG